MFNLGVVIGIVGIVLGTWGVVIKPKKNSRRVFAAGLVLLIVGLLITVIWPPICSH
jgi:hypothetical protein